MKQLCKKALSVFLSLIMVVSLFAIGGITDMIPKASAAVTMKTTQKSAISGSSDYIAVEYPSDIYVSLGDNLSSTGKYMKFTGHYGSNANYRVWVASGIWGGQSYDVKSSWGHNSSFSGSYKPTNQTLMNNFGSFGMYSKEIYHSGSTGSYGTGSYYAFDNWGSQLVYGCENPNNLEMYLYFIGTPNAIGNYTYSSSGTSPLWYIQNRPSGGSWGSTVSGSFDADVSFTIHVYDKSALKTAIDSSSGFESSLYTPTSWATFSSALASAKSIRDTEEVSQEQINSATNALNTAIAGLEMSLDDLSISKWNGSNSEWLIFGTESGDYLRSTYPSKIYIDMSESLDDAGYYVQLNGHYGDSNNYSILVYDFLWGGSTSTSNCKLSNSFNNYSFDGTINGVRGVNSATDGQSNAGNNYWKANTGNLNEKVYLVGTPKAVTAEAGVNYTTSGSGGSTQTVIFRQKSGSSWTNSTIYTKDTGCSGSNVTNPSSTNAYWRDIAINVTIYDKSALKSALDEAVLINTDDYTDKSVAAFNAALPTAATVYAKRETTQSAITSAATALQNALDRLVNKDDAIETDPWDGSDTQWILFGSESGDYLKSVYPGVIYLDKTETLEDAGYYVQLTGHYGGVSDTNYGIMAFDYLWAGSSSSTNFKLSSVFPDYSFDGTVDGVRGVNSNRGQSNGSYQTDSNRIYLKWNSYAVNEKVYLIGTPNGVTATDGVTVSTSGSGSNCMAYVKDSTYTVKNKDSSASSSVMDGTWREMQITAIVYDKTPLKQAINKANDILTANAAYSALAKAGTISAVNSAVTAGNTAISTRKIKQPAIDTAKTNVVNAAAALVYGANDSALQTSITAAEAIVNESGYADNYSLATRQALENAIATAKANTSLTATYNAYSDTQAGAKAQANQNTINTYKANIDAAIEAMDLLAPDFSAFNTHYDAHSTLEHGICYSAATLTAYNNAVTAVNNLKANTSLTKKANQSEVDTATATYISAFSALVVEHNYNSVVTQPTCTEQGYTTHTCANCGDTYKDTYVAATGHAYGAWTSNNDGTHSKECANCSDKVTESCSIVTTVTPSTCTEAGYTTHTCSVCGYSYIDGNTAALGHSWDSGVITTPATCTEPGEKTFTCGTCHITRVDPITATGHSYTDTVTPPTCTDKGYTTHTCGNCGDTYTDTEVPALGHSWNAGVVTTAPTCTENGVMTFTCLVCGNIKTETIGALGHDYDAAVTDPTCTEKGYTTHTCSRCSDSYTDSETSALGHLTYVSKVAKDATCTEAGWTEEVKCSRCNLVITDSVAIAALGHAYGAWTSNNDGTHTKVCSRCNDTVTDTCHTTTTVIAPTCTEQGYTLHGCPICEYGYKDNYTPATGHTSFVFKAAKAATCTEAGWTAETRCAVCGIVLSPSTTITALGHDYNSVVTAPTCTSGGYTTYTCSRCGDSYTADQTAALGHSWDSGVVTSAATCTTNGTKTFTCSTCGSIRTETITATGHDWDAGVVTTAPTCSQAGVKTITCQICGEEKYESIPMIPHSYTSAVTAPTCTESGYTTYTCSVCGNSYKGNIIPAFGHSYTGVVTAPTCTTGGYTTYTCSICSDTYVGDEVPALGHSYTDVVTAPTCTTDGYTTHTCSVCGDTFVDSLVAATGHNYVDTVVAPSCTTEGYTRHTCGNCGIYYDDTFTPAIGHSYAEVERVEATSTMSGYILYRCANCGAEYKEILYFEGKAVVYCTIYNSDGAPVVGATITVTNDDTGESFEITTDKNGYFTQVLPEGSYTLSIKAEGYDDTEGYITVVNGKATVTLPTLAVNHCSCICHQNNVWAKIYKIICKILKLFGKTVICCDDCELWS